MSSSTRERARLIEPIDKEVSGSGSVCVNADTQLLERPDAVEIDTARQAIGNPRHLPHVYREISTRVLGDCDLFA